MKTVVLNVALCNEPVPSAGWYWPELEVDQDAVWIITHHSPLTTHHTPTGGNSPKAVRQRSKLATSTVGTALQEAILADYKAGKL